MARANTVTYLLGTRFYKMAYVEFGNPAAPAVLCVHGLTRTGRDFDPLAEALSDRFHVICPDLPGRGVRTGWARRWPISRRAMWWRWRICWPR